MVASVCLSVPKVHEYVPIFIQARNQSKALAMLVGEENLKGAAALDLVVGDICDMSSLRPALFKVKSKERFAGCVQHLAARYLSIWKDLFCSRKPDRTTVL